MKSVTTKKFWNAFDSLPVNVQKRAEKKYELFTENYNHPGLRLKKVLNPDIYSVRITQNYRALGVMRDDKIIWFWIGTHQKYEKLLRKL